jgi:hypothetical protein
MAAEQARKAIKMPASAGRKRDGIALFDVLDDRFPLRNMRLLE